MYILKLLHYTFYRGDTIFHKKKIIILTIFLMLFFIGSSAVAASNNNSKNPQIHSSNYASNIEITKKIQSSKTKKIIPKVHVVQYYYMLKRGMMYFLSEEIPHTMQILILSN